MTLARTAVVMTSLAWCFGIGFPAAMAAEPAFVTRVGGYDVTVMRQGEAIPVRVQMLISAGETVSAGEDSFVEVRYLSDGCVVRVANGRSLVVATSSPCGDAASQAKVAAKQTETKALPAETVASAPKEDEAVARVTGRSGPLARANFGEGLVDLKTGAELKAGDRVFAGQGSSITLFFPKANCEHVVPAESYLEITDTAPCKQAAAPAEPGTSGAGVAGAEAGAAIGALLLIGGGGAAAALLLTGEEDDDGGPVTPN